MLQWTLRLGQNVTVDVVNLDVTSRQRTSHLPEEELPPGSHTGQLPLECPWGETCSPRKQTRQQAIPPRTLEAVGEGGEWLCRQPWLLVDGHNSSRITHCWGHRCRRPVIKTTFRVRLTIFKTIQVVDLLYYSLRIFSHAVRGSAALQKLYFGGVLDPSGKVG
jgi:hypothetical protein